MDKIIRMASSGASNDMTPSKPTRLAPAPPDSSRPFLDSPPLSPPPATLPPSPPFARPQTSHADDETDVAPSTASRRRGSISEFVARASSHKVPTIRSTSQSGRNKTMLRKQKGRDQEEYLRQQRLLNQVPKEPPQIPSPLPMPILDGFGGGGQDRPDSLAIFAGKFNEQQPASNTTTRTPVNNFSRPGYMTASSSANSLNAPSLPSYSHLHSSPSARTNASSKTGDHLDPYARTESMTNRGRESYSSPALSIGGGVNSPRRMRRRKDPTPFNILIVGAKQSGKTSFVEFLKTSLALPESKRAKSHSPVGEPTHPDAAFVSSYLESEINGERIGLTLWDSKGLEKNIVDLQLREVTSFIESKFEETFAEEQKVVRSPSAKDTHIHCVLLIMDPARLDFAAKQPQSPHRQTSISSRVQSRDDELDLQAMRALSGKTTVIPIISKSDTLTSAHMNSLKRSVWSSIQSAKLDPLEAMGLEEESDEGDDSESSRDASSSDVEHQTPAHVKVTQSTDDGSYDDGSLISNLVSRGSSTTETTPSPGLGTSSKANRRISGVISQLPSSAPSVNSELCYIPFSVLSPDPYTLPHGLTRVFPWGEADPLNPLHCDFLRLKESVFGEWRSELRAASREKWYEGWRTSRLKRTPGGGIGSMKIRQAGGVTPARAIPREGRTSPINNRKASAGDEDFRHRVRASIHKAERTLGSPRGAGKAERVLGDPTGLAI